MFISARHIMRKKISVGTDTNVKDAAHKFISTGKPGLPVVDENMEVIGIVTEFNVLGAMREGLDLEKITVLRIMSTSPTIADMNTSCNDVIEMLLLNNFTIIPIVSNKKYVGMVSRHTIMDAYLSPRYTNFASQERVLPFTCI